LLLLGGASVLILRVIVVYHFDPYFLNDKSIITAIQINWLPFLPGLACHSIHQVKTPGLTAYQAACLGAGQT
jgi:hypothetical protein